MTHASTLLQGAAALAFLLSSACASQAQTPAPGVTIPADSYLERLPQDEIIYFVMPDRFENGDPSNDRGGLAGDRVTHGFDPSDTGFYHGGDLKGLTSRLDYIQSLGMTAIWLTPIFRNKPVQGPPGLESAAYHGYWITDFTTVDPHLGTKGDFKAFVDAVHARGMKVYMDIITNHTADVIQYRDCGASAAPGDGPAEDPCPYRSMADYPWSTRGGVDGAPINDGFAGVDVAAADNFAKLTTPDWAYDAYVPEGEEAVKTPAWLNDPLYYHNRGNSSFEGESSRMGDFAGLDDVMTENPAVVEGFIDIYKQWITDYRVDGFRIDTARHVNPEFWQAFVPAMEAHAAFRTSMSSGRSMSLSPAIWPPIQHATSSPQCSILPSRAWCAMSLLTAPRRAASSAFSKWTTPMRRGWRRQPSFRPFLAITIWAVLPASCARPIRR